MNKIVTFAVIGCGALALAACGPKAEEAATEAAAPEVMMPEGETPAAEETPAVAETPAVDEAATSAEDLEGTNNPIGPN
jgi:hypothetical protein